MASGAELSGGGACAGLTAAADAVATSVRVLTRAELPGGAGSGISGVLSTWWGIASSCAPASMAGGLSGGTACAGLTAAAGAVAASVQVLTGAGLPGGAESGISDVLSTC